MARPRVAEGGEATPPWLVLTPAIIEQLDQKLAKAIEVGFAEVTLVVERGKLRWVRGPAPSEPVRME